MYADGTVGRPIGSLMLGLQARPAAAAAAAAPADAPADAPAAAPAYRGLSAAIEAPSCGYRSLAAAGPPTGVAPRRNGAPRDDDRRPSLARRRSSREMYEDGTFPRPFGCRLLGLGTPLQGRAAAAPAAAAADVEEAADAAMMAMQDGHADDIASAAAAQPEAVPPPDCVPEVEEDEPSSSRWDEVHLYSRYEWEPCKRFGTPLLVARTDEAARRAQQALSELTPVQFDMDEPEADRGAISVCESGVFRYE